MHVALLDFWTAVQTFKGGDLEYLVGIGNPGFRECTRNWEIPLCCLVFELQYFSEVLRPSSDPSKP